MNISMEMSIAELKEIAKKNKMKGYSKYNKEELYYKLLELEEEKEKKESKKTKKIGKIEKNKSDDKEEKEQENKNIVSNNNINNKVEDEYVLTDVHIFEKGDSVYLCEKTGNMKIKRADGREIEISEDSEKVEGYLDIVSNDYGFLRNGSLKPTDDDIYIPKNVIDSMGLKYGDYVVGLGRKAQNNKKPSIYYVTDVNGLRSDRLRNRVAFEDLRPIYPNKRIDLGNSNCSSNRIISMFSPIGYGQRSLIVSPPKAGKTTILKNLAKRISEIGGDTELLILLIDERPEEVTDMQDSVPNVEVFSSTFDERPEDHIHMAEFTLELAKRKVEAGKNVVVLLDSITRLARAYNLVVPSSGKVLSGGFDPTALYKPKKFFGAARNLENGKSLTIIATALVETGSKMDDLIYEEFKGTGNMELHLERSLAEERLYPAINIKKSGTREDTLLYPKNEKNIIDNVRKTMSSGSDQDFLNAILEAMKLTKTNDQLLDILKKI